MDLVRELLAYIDDRDQGERVAALLARHGRPRVFQAAVTLLAWLRRCGDGTLAPLVLSQSNPLDRIVHEVMNDAELAHVFRLVGFSIDFQGHVPASERREIAKFVADNYRPERKLNDL